MPTSHVYRIVPTFAVVAGFSCCALGHQAPKSGYQEVNGVKYYYEITGKGEPLLLLHGGFGYIDMVSPSRSKLEKNHKVIAIDLHGHGRTALGSRHISLVDQGADMAVLVKKLGFKQVDVVGYSMGGGVGFQFAVQHPEEVHKLVLVSTPIARDDSYPEDLKIQLDASMLPSFMGSPMYEGYMKIAPHSRDFAKLLDQMGALMKKPYDWYGEVSKLTMPVMLVYGDSDMIRPERMVKFYQRLGGGLKDPGYMRENMSKNRLAILPNVTHYDIPDSPQLIPTVLSFLEAKTQGK